MTIAITRLEVRSIPNRVVIQASEEADTRRLCLDNSLIAAFRVSVELSGEVAPAKK